MFRGALALLGGAVVGASTKAYSSIGSSRDGAAYLAHAAAPPPPKVLDPDEFKSFTLLSSQYETHDTRRFHFSTGDPNVPLALPTASCIVLKYTDKDGNAVIRPYTPTSPNDRAGSFELIIKKYPKSKMATHVFQLQNGESVEMKGPFVKFKYTPNQFKHVALVAGGTGITPMYQLIRTVLDNPLDKTHLSLVYANKSRKDILLNNELSELARVYPNFDVYFTLSDVPKRWLGGVGHITKEVLQTFLPKAGDSKNSKIFVCGPSGMMGAISGDKVYDGKGPPQQGPVAGLLGELGYTPDQVFKF